MLFQHNQQEGIEVNGRTLSGVLNEGQQMLRHRQPCRIVVIECVAYNIHDALDREHSPITALPLLQYHNQVGQCLWTNIGPILAYALARDYANSAQQKLLLASLQVKTLQTPNLELAIATQAGLHCVENYGLKHLLDGAKPSETDKHQVKEHGADLHEGLPSILLQCFYAMKHLQEEAPSSRRDVALHHARQPAESEHFDIILEHPCASQQPPYWS